MNSDFAVVKFRKSLCLLKLSIFILTGLGGSLLGQDLPYHMYFNEDSSRMKTGFMESTGFYDESQIRELRLYFYDTDFWQAMHDNYNTDTYVLASLHYGENQYDSVAVQFKGQTSYRQAVKQGSEKLSFSIKIDEVIEEQDIDGYNNFNLNNAFQDFSFMKEVLYARLSREFIPALKGNFIKLFLNDEYWGIYANIQQLNGDFLEEWFPDDKGIRWRADVPATTLSASQEEIKEGGGGTQWGDGTAALNYLGDTIETYQQYYTLKDSDLEDPWDYLLRVCDVLNNTDSVKLYDSLQKVMDVDATLWYLAQEIVFSDDDSYVHKGKMDYYLFFEASTGMIIPLEFDGNSAMSLRNRDWSPFLNEENPNYPLLNRLLAVPELRQRYIAHVKTILSIAFEREHAMGIIDAYEAMINPLLQVDPKIDFTMEDHNRDLNRLRNFINSRPDIIFSNPEFQEEAPQLTDLVRLVNGEQKNGVLYGDKVVITSRAIHEEGIKRLHLFYGKGLRGRFEVKEMNDSGIDGDENAGDGIFSASIPDQASGEYVRYYIEATANNISGTVSYMPERAAYEVFIFQVQPLQADEKTIVINEILASNSRVLADEFGEYDDCAELYNTTENSMSLEGYHLSDDPFNIYKWRFPDIEIQANDYLTVWLDDDTEQGELHTNFKLSADGESLILSDADGVIIDQLHFGPQTGNITYGRWPNGSGDFIFMYPSLNLENNNTSVNIKSQQTDVSRIYPNPTNGILYLDVAEELQEHIFIFDLSGKVAWNGEFRETLDLSSLKAGIYILRCSSEYFRLVIY